MNDGRGVKTRQSSQIAGRRLMAAAAFVAVMASSSLVRAQQLPASVLNLENAEVQILPVRGSIFMLTV